MRNIFKSEKEIWADQRGYTILEVLIALAVFAIGILGVATMQTRATGSTANARMYSEASELAQSRAEQLMLEDYATLANGNEVGADGYTTQWSVTALAGITGLEITVQVWAPRDPIGGNPRTSITFKRFESP